MTKLAEALKNRPSDGGIRLIKTALISLTLHLAQAANSQDIAHIFDLLHTGLQLFNITDI
jgi:hypothetical protein